MSVTVALNEKGDIPAPTISRYRLQFHGQGSEYFGIWIVNLALSILTLGIYSAWAKVRTQRYFHGATELDGSRFGYHAKPKAILIGRVIAVLLFLPYLLLKQVNPIASGVALVVGLCVMPWLIFRAMRFRLAVTSYRNLRFSFDSSSPTLRGAYLNYLLLPILTIPTLSWILPFVQHQQFQWLAKNTRFGQTPFTFRPGVGRFYRAYVEIIAAGLLIGALVGFGIFEVIKVAHDSGQLLFPDHAAAMPQRPPAMLFVLLAILEVVFIVGSMAYHAWLHKLAYDSVMIGDIKVVAHMTRKGLFGLYFGNLLLLFVTLGLAYPWARCRVVKYVVENLELIAPSGLDHFTSGSEDGVSAIADQVASTFDIDIGFGF